MITFRNSLFGKHIETDMTKSGYSAKQPEINLLGLCAFTLFTCNLLTPAIAEEQEGYLAITAVTVPTKRDQPTWVALKKSGSTSFLHAPTDQALITLAPGDYEIDHIDICQKSCSDGHSELGKVLRFSSNRNSSKENQFRSIEVKPGMITIYGTLLLKANGNKYDIELHQAATSIPWLCTHNEELLRDNLVYLLEPDMSYKTIKINCINPEEKTSKI